MCLRTWEIQKVLAKWIWRIVMHLDRGIVVSLGIKPVIACAMECYKVVVFEHLYPHFREQIFDLIDLIRDDNHDELILLIKDCIEVLLLSFLCV